MSNKNSPEEVTMQDALKIVGRMKNELRTISKSSDANTIIGSLNALSILVNRLEKACAGASGTISSKDK
jgi:hypothetical protein